MHRDMIEHVAKAIAWDELTPKGRTECTWPGSFSEAEAGKYRMQAVAAISALDDYQQQRAKGSEG